MKFWALTILMFSSVLCYAQSGYKQGDVVKNFGAAVILNNNGKEGTLEELKKEITIIDFFGTWCAPCIRALPNLSAIQKNNADKVAVILISVEKESTLQGFLEKRKTVDFPVFIDADKSISNLFQPASYPYTVVLNKQNQIIAVKEAAEITDDNINEWLQAKPKAGTKPETNVNEPRLNNNSMELENSPNSIVALSEQFIYAAKSGAETSGLLEKLKLLSYQDLQNSLHNDADKKAFWINIYNGSTQYALKSNPEKYSKRSKFFKAKQISIAGKTFSLDEIEHDILRRNKVKWSLGYFNKLFPGKKAKTLREDKLDYRIHFALNCGARSCPPIAFYKSENIDQQLDVATRAYLTGEATYDAAKNRLYLPAIMGWFRRDFKGKRNMLILAKKYGIVPQNKQPSISFKKYDWNLFLNNYNN
ncbi:MAG: DUF547 domain-containing protein [Chitinophagaceae bacterium]|nr:MAG: DUF547 domain-containing protein [Chitinophagaceae bacterium]